LQGSGQKKSADGGFLSEYDDFDPEKWAEEERPSDPREAEALEDLTAFFREHREQVFFSRQLEVQNEGKHFHWITNRALRELKGQGLLQGETRPLKAGGSINLLWHRSYRFHKRSAANLVRLVEEYADPNIGGVLGLHGETMVLEGFARSEFVMRGRNTRSFGEKTWEATGQNLDFLFERDGITYGIEVKNTLGYMDRGQDPAQPIPWDQASFCGADDAQDLDERADRGGRVRAGPEDQLYPWTHKELARRVAHELGLPVDAPKALAEGTMGRFPKWHEKKL